MGSAANAAAAERLVKYFAQLGYAPQQQAATVKVPNHGEVSIRNVFVRREGRRQLPAILLVSHYDSVALAPGGGDNGMGVAVCLDAARMLAAGPAPERPVVILITDGEEAGLLGAKLFAQNHPWANDVGAVINVDNRGGDGPAQLYETGHDDLALIRAIAPCISHPVMGSFFVEVSRRMPNGTDLSAFLERGLTGINIACSGAIERYHTPADTFDAVNLAALQHEGDMATEALAGFINMPENSVYSGCAVFLDIFGRFLLVWPAALGVLLSLAAAAGVATVGWHVSRGVRPANAAGRDAAARGYFKGAVAAASALAGTGAIVLGLSYIMERSNFFGMGYAETALAQRMPGVTNPPWATKMAAAYWPSHGIYVELALGAACIPVAWLCATLLLRNCSPWSSWSGAWSVPAVINVIVSLIEPGASAILLPIVLSAACAAWIGVLVFGTRSVAAPLLALLVPIAVASVVYAPLEALGWPAVGLSMPPFRGMLSGMYAMFLLMLFVPGRPRETAAATTANR